MSEQTVSSGTGWSDARDAVTPASATDEDVERAVHLPPPSIWPIVSAFGVTMLGFGFLAGIVYGIFGVIVLIISLWGWIGEMRHE